MDGGETKSPSGTSGPIGQALQNFSADAPFVRYSRIPNVFINNIDDDLFHDRKDLRSHLDMCKMASSGDTIEKYLLKALEPHHTARFTNTFTNIVNLYLRTPKPSRELRIMTKVIVLAYCQSIVEIYLQPEAHLGTLHLFNYMKRAQSCLFKAEFEVVLTYFINNSYYFHPEAVLFYGELHTINQTIIFNLPISPKNAEHHVIFYYN